MQVSPGQSTLSLLPPWHIYERSVAYYILSSGARQIYTSVPRLKADLALYKPNFVVCVPLVLATLYDRIIGTMKKMHAMRSSLAMWLIGVAETHVRVRRNIVLPHSVPCVGLLGSTLALSNSLFESQCVPLQCAHFTVHMYVQCLF
jgi:long-subunit acyl-CoA synthetase (AMP-forming)